MRERTGVVTLKGKPVTLLGPEIRVGDKAPDFRVVDTGIGIAPEAHARIFERFTQADGAVLAAVKGITG